MPPYTQYSMAKAAPFHQDNQHFPRDYHTADSMVLAVLEAIRSLKPHFWSIGIQEAVYGKDHS
jgi:hypothetical protein